ncbi:MAG: hypothetical protein Q8L85_05065 [Alphaproteobacteria bacterium]|nr:hypothetical protein [Alphaproteobacteria bacterium]
MKTKLCLSLAFATILMTSSFSAFADQAQRFKVDHNAKHDDVNHADTKGVVTLFQAQQYKVLPNNKMVPIGKLRTNVHVAATDELHSDPNLEKKVVEGLADDPATLSIFSTLASVASKVVSTVASHASTLVSSAIGVVKGLVSNPGVQQAAKEAVVGGAISTALAVGTSVLLPSKTTPAPADPNAQPAQ